MGRGEGRDVGPGQVERTSLCQQQGIIIQV